MYAEADPDLIDRARRERAAFGELYDMYGLRVYAFCLSVGGERKAAEDLTSQTFERALRVIRRYEHRGAPFSSWLFRIAANLAIDRARGSGRLIHMGDAMATSEPEDESQENDPEALVVRWERATLLRLRLASLPTDQQQAVRLHYWENRSVTEVAELMRRNENAIKQLLHRAMVNLRNRMGDEGRHA